MSILERPRINALLEKAMKNRVVFITASEGYGKTYAVKSFLSQRNSNYLWIPITERDNDPWHFWENVVQAVSIKEKHTGKFLEEIGFPESKSQMVHYLSALYGPGSSRKGIIVVDDCHLIHDERVLNFVNGLLAFPLRKETTIMISRTSLELNTMSLLSKGLLSEMNADDLRFNDEEISCFFRLRNINLAREDVDGIIADTDGWALAINLIAEEMSRGNKKYSPAYLKSDSFKRMKEALFASIPEPFKRLLVILSLFEQWPMEAIEEIAASMPDKLPQKDDLQKNLISISSLINYDTYLQGLRIHRVFLDFLKENQGMLLREEIKTACIIKARWCMKNRLWVDAAMNYRLAGDYLGIRNAIYSFPRLISGAATVSFLDIIDKMIKENDKDKNDKNYLFLCHVTRAAMLLNLGRYGESKNAIRESIKKFESTTHNDLACMVLSSCYDILAILSIVTCRTTGDMNSSIEYFRKANYYHEQSSGIGSDPMGMTYIGAYMNIIGYPPGQKDHEKFIETISQCIPYTSAAVCGSLLGIDSLCRAELSFFCGNLDIAEQYARRGVIKTRENRQYEAESKGLFYLLRIYLSRGDLSELSETQKQMEVLLDKTEYINRFALHDIMTGWYYAHTGETEKIAPWLCKDYREDDLNFMIDGYEIIVRAKILFAEKRYEEALKLLRTDEIRKNLGSFHFGMLEITALEAAILCRMGNTDTAVTALEKSYNISAGSFDMPFIELGQDIKTLSTLAMNTSKCTIPRKWLESIQTKSSAYGKKLITIAGQYENSHKDDTIPLLSPQERAILQKISRGLTREEISNEFSMSINVVKKTIKVIYKKLGALNRADAIRIAGKSGLLAK